MIKIILNYNNESYSLDIQQYQKLSTVKKKAYKIFFPIKTDIDIKYDNKSMSSNLDKPIGIIFNGKTFIRLDIVSIPGKKLSLKLKPKNNNENIKTIKTEKKTVDLENHIKITQNLMNEISINNNRNKIKLNALNKNKNVENTKTENIIIKKEKNDNLYENLNLKKNGKKKLPPIKTENNNKKEKEKENNDIIAYNKCGECKKNNSSEYCRKCNKFLCLNCSNKNHSKEEHKLIEIDTNEKININRYKEEINKDLYNSLKSFNYINKENFDINKSKKNFENMINSLIDVAEGYKDNLNEEYNLNIEENKKKIESDLNIIKKDITNINDNINNDGINIFKEFNMKDRNINKLKNEYKCETNSEFINHKIQKMFLDIEDEIDKVMFELEESIDLGKISELKNNSIKL